MKRLIGIGVLVAIGVPCSLRAKLLNPLLPFGPLGGFTVQRLQSLSQANSAWPANLCGMVATFHACQDVRGNPINSASEPAFENFMNQYITIMEAFAYTPDRGSDPLPWRRGQMLYDNQVQELINREGYQDVIQR
jgi:hypothetical protein